MEACPEAASGRYKTPKLNCPQNFKTKAKILPETHLGQYKWEKVYFLQVPGNTMEKHQLEQVAFHPRFS